MEAFQDFWVIDLLTMWPKGTFLGIILIASTLLGIILIGILIFAVLNEAFCKKQRALGTVLHKEFIPAHAETSTQHDAEGVAYTQTHWICDQWRIKVRVGDMTGSFYLDADEAPRDIEETDVFMIEYIITRLTKQFTPKRLFSANSKET